MKAPKYNIGDLVELETGERLYIAAPFFTAKGEVSYKLGVVIPDYQPSFRAEQLTGCYPESELTLIKDHTGEQVRP